MNTPLVPAMIALRLEVERTHAHGRALGLTPETVDAVIRQRSEAARETPWPLDWSAVRSALITQATTPTTNGDR